SSDEEEEEEHDEEDDDEDGEDESEEADMYEVVCDFTGEQKDDLTIKTGDIVDILFKRVINVDDGWWKAENEEGKVGLVPSTYLKKYEEEEEDVEAGVEVEEPTSDVQEPEQVVELKDPEIEDTTTEKTDVTDVLAAMGALPAGFRPSMMHNLLTKNDDYSLRTALLPLLSPSQLGFANLHWNHATNQLRRVVTRVLRSCRLWKCKMIPVPSTGVEVMSRHVRMALFDGTNVLSNIHTVRAQAEDTKPKLWGFPTAKTDGILPSMVDGYSIVRSDCNHSNIGILFELGITYIRSQTGEKGEMSCGWVHLKLFDEQGNAIPNKTYELGLNGGTPYEQGVEVDPSIKKRAATNRFRALLEMDKQPKLMVQIGTPSNEKRKYLELLPSSIVLTTALTEVVSYFRRVLVDALVRNRVSSTDADLVHSPAIATFLEALAHSDIMDAIRVLWTEKTQGLTRADKRDKDNLKAVFKSVVMETAYPLLHSSGLPKAKWADVQNESQRWQYISQTIQSTKLPNGVLSYFLSSSDNVQPFDISELTYDVIRDHG
uniref:SH3 domain-containing protein n=1 Tax=Ciona savignyi TaxID=51511 RepID=H2ZDQ0_CIOSA